MPITVVCGIDRAPTTAVARSLLARDRRAALLTHCLDQVELGLVSRTVERADGSVEPGLLELAHGCVSCTLREDVLPTLVALSRDGRTSGVVLLLPEVVEPIGFVEAFHGVELDPGRTAADECHLTGIVSVVSASTLIARLAEADTLFDAGMTSLVEDERTVGEVLARQVETADVVVAFDAPATERGLLRLLNPEARLTREPAPPSTPFDLDSMVRRADPTEVLPGPALQREGDAWLLNWRSRRPFHPGRLHDALDDVIGLTLRGRGETWIASRPDAVVGWESTGPRLNLGRAGTWLQRGRNALVLTGIADDPTDVAIALDHCVLTDDELAEGDLAWQFYDDPFAAVWEAADAADDDAA